MPAPQGGAVTRRIADLPRPYAPTRYVGLQQLKASILTQGVLNPIVLSALGNVVDGYRRIQAADELGLAEVPAVVNAAIDTPEKEVGAILGSEVRADRSVMDHARLVRAHAPHFPTQRAMAEAMGLPEGKVSNLLALTEYPEVIQELLGEGKLTLTHHTAVAKLPLEKREELLATAAREGWGVRKLEAATLPPKRKAPPKLMRQEYGQVTLVFPAQLPIGQLKDELDKAAGVASEKLKAASKSALPCGQVFRA